MIPILFARFVDPMPLVDSTIAFATAFSLETLVPSNGAWTKIPVGATLAVAILLISWCVWAILEVKTDIDILDGVHVFKDNLVKFTRGLLGSGSQDRTAIEMGDVNNEETRGMV